MLISFAHASVGDGVCDSSDLLSNSPDCSSMVYITTPRGGPLESIVIPPSDSNSTVISILARNLDSRRPGVVCISAEPPLHIFDNSGYVNSICSSVPAAGTTSISVGISYPRVHPPATVGHLVIATSTTTKTIPVYIQSVGPLSVVSAPNIAVSAALFVFAAFVFFLTTRIH